jgi:hypothetical protein
MLRARPRSAAGVFCPRKKDVLTTPVTAPVMHTDGILPGNRVPLARFNRKLLPHHSLDNCSISHSGP